MNLHGNHLGDLHSNDIVCLAQEEILDIMRYMIWNKAKKNAVSFELLFELMSI